MRYSHAEIIRELLSPDGKARVDVLERHDGLYEFRGYVERRLLSGPDEGDPYWSPVEYSGLYETRGEVEPAALAAVWGLRGRNPN